jgi:beta-1,4-mannosyltransferase
VVLFFGQLRPYKRPVSLIELFRRAARAEDRLLIAGKPITKDLAEAVRDAAGSDARITLFLDVVERVEVQYWLRAADLVVLPYERITNSGAAMLALDFDRPVVAPAQGSLVELARSVGERWVTLFDGSFDERVLMHALTMPLPSGAPDLTAHEWGGLGKRTLEAFLSVREGRAQARRRCA